MGHKQPPSGPDNGMFTTCRITERDPFEKTYPSITKKLKNFRYIHQTSANRGRVMHICISKLSQYCFRVIDNCCPNYRKQSFLNFHAKLNKKLLAKLQPFWCSLDDHLYIVSFFIVVYLIIEPIVLCVHIIVRFMGPLFNVFFKKVLPNSYNVCIYFFLCYNMSKSPIKVVRYSVIRPQLVIVGKSVMSPFHRGSMQLSIPT